MERATLYNHLKLHLKEAIQAGEYRPGDQVPSEHELMIQFNVSRATARKAISDLVLEGWLYRVQGRGTFVAKPKFPQTLSRLTSFTEDMRLLGLIPGARLLSSQVEEASQEVSERLSLSPGELVIRVERLRLANDKPMALNISVLPYRLVPGLEHEDLEQNSLYQTLEDRYNLVLSRAEETLETSLADSEIAELLEIPVGAPLLFVDGVVFLKNGVPIEWVRIWYRGDRYRFYITAVR
jgi:GntR family transcriptional regulator